MAVNAIDPGSIPGGDQFFNPCTFSKKEDQWRSINIGYAPILLISHIIYYFLIGEVKAVCTRDISLKSLYIQ